LRRPSFPFFFGLISPPCFSVLGGIFPWRFSRECKKTVFDERVGLVGPRLLRYCFPWPPLFPFLPFSSFVLHDPFFCLKGPCVVSCCLWWATVAPPAPPRLFFSTACALLSMPRTVGFPCPPSRGPLSGSGRCCKLELFFLFLPLPPLALFFLFFLSLALDDFSDRLAENLPPLFPVALAPAGRWSVY